MPNASFSHFTKGFPSSVKQSANTPKAPIAADSRAEALLAQLDRTRLPGHVAMIMDGNGRWAREHGYADRTKGHEMAINSVRQVTRAAAELKLRTLTLFSFSTENWRRPRKEVAFLMHLLRRFLVEERREMMDNGIRLVHSGRMEDLPLYARVALQNTITLTAKNEGMVLNLAISYGGRAEIVEATQRIAAAVKAGKLSLKDVDENYLAQMMYHPELGDPDLMIRTSGEMRISNFLLWQLAYSEIYVTQTLWPDFGRADLLEALLAYQKRQRRFGAVG